MPRYILTRLVLSIPVILGVTLIAFLILYLTPSDLVTNLLGTRSTPEDQAALREKLGLGQPVLVQYGRWSANVVQAFW